MLATFIHLITLTLKLKSLVKILSQQSCYNEETKRESVIKEWFYEL